MEYKFVGAAEKIASDGSGIVRVLSDNENRGDVGQKYFVPGAAPGDVLRCIVADEAKNRAAILEIVEPSPDRIAPRCAQYAVCGGCSLQHLRYQGQLNAKIDLLRDTLLHIGGLSSLPEITVAASPPFEYRNRIQLHRLDAQNDLHNAVNLKKRMRSLSVRKDGNGFSAAKYGFMSAKSNTIISLQDCPVCVPVIRDALQKGSLAIPPDKDRWTVYGNGDLLLSEAGANRGQINLCGQRSIKLDAGVFFQSNAALLETLICDVLKIAEKSDSNMAAADFYCGVGTFAAFLQDRFSRIDLFDQNKAAIALARENVKNQGAAFFAFDDDAWVKSGKAGRSYGFVLADPGRQGLSSLMRKWLCETKPELFCYVSCNPAALAHNARELAANAFALESLTLYDFYPQTPHIESLAVFVSNERKARGN